MGKRNWTIHSIATALVAAGWIAIVVAHPDRDGLAGLGNAIVVAITGMLALVYTLATSLGVFLVRDRRWGAVMVHGSALIGIVGAFGLMLATA